jgi:biopolymer transport protein TolR
MAFGRLERTKLPEPMSEINVTPLVDVMLVLVVIFIITAPLLASAIRLDLPKAEGTQGGEPEAFVSLAIDPTGKLFLNDRPVTPQELGQRLSARAKENPATEVQLRADRNVPYGKVVEVMGIAHQSGLSRIGFVAEPAK